MTGYKLELLSPETIKLLGSTKKYVDQEKYEEDVPKLESVEVVLVHSETGLGFNFRGCAMSQTREYKWKLGFRGGGAFCAPEDNAFRAISSLKPV